MMSESEIVTNTELAAEKARESDESVNEGEDLNAADADVTNTLLKIGDESIKKLISQGIDAVDVKKLIDANISSCYELLLFRSKMSLNQIEGMSSDKVNRILEAAETLVGSVSGFIEEHIKEPTAEQKTEIVEMLRSHLQKTYDDDPLIRRDALLAIKDMLMRRAEIARLHTYAIVKAFKRLIEDEDKQNQSLSHEIFVAMISNNLKEDDQSMILKMLMQSTLEALTLPNPRTCVSAFQFLGRLLHWNPPFSPADAEKIIETCGMFLRDDSDNCTEHDKSVLLDSLNSFLTLLPWNKKRTNLHFDAKEIDVIVQDESLVHYYAFSPVIPKMMFLVPVLVNRFRFLITNAPNDLHDKNTFDHLASLLNGINLIVCSFTKSKYQDSIDGANINVWDEEVSIYFRSLFDCFPLFFISQSTDKESHERRLDLNLVMAKTLFQCLPHYSEYLSNFLGFIGKVLDGKLCNVEESNEALWSVHLNELVYLIPRVISFEAKLTNNKPSHLLKAFTYAFRKSRVGSSLKLACLHTIEDVLLPLHTSYVCLRMDSRRKSEYVDNIIEWMSEFTSLLKELSPAESLVGIQLLVSFGKWVGRHPSLLEMYNKIQGSLPDFLGKRNEGEPLNGHFLCLPKSSKQMILSCLMNFSSLEWPLLNFLLECCSSPRIDFDTIFVMIGIVNSFEIPDVKVDDYINFSFSLVLRFKSSSSTLKKIGNVFGSYMEKNAVHFNESFHVIENRVFDAIVWEPCVDNVFSLLKMIASLGEVTHLINGGMLRTVCPYLFMHLKNLGELKHLHQLPTPSTDVLAIQLAINIWETAQGYAKRHY